MSEENFLKKGYRERFFEYFYRSKAVVNCVESALNLGDALARARDMADILDAYSLFKKSCKITLPSIEAEIRRREKGTVYVKKYEVEKKGGEYVKKGKTERVPLIQALREHMWGKIAESRTPEELFIKMREMKEELIQGLTMAKGGGMYRYKGKVFKYEVETTPVRLLPYLGIGSYDFDEYLIRHSLIMNIIDKEIKETKFYKYDVRKGRRVPKGLLEDFKKELSGYVGKNVVEKHFNRFILDFSLLLTDVIKSALAVPPHLELINKAENCVNTAVYMTTSEYFGTPVLLQDAIKYLKPFKDSSVRVSMILNEITGVREEVPIIYKVAKELGVASSYEELRGITLDELYKKTARALKEEYEREKSIREAEERGVKVVGLTPRTSKEIIEPSVFHRVAERLSELADYLTYKKEGKPLPKSPYRKVSR